MLSPKTSNFHFSGKTHFSEAFRAYPAWDDRWAEHHDDGENGDGSVPRVILDSFNECCLEITDDAGKDIGEQLGFGDDGRNPRNDFGTHCINPMDRKTLNFICTTTDGECKPVNMYKDDFLAQAFPTLFPYGWIYRSKKKNGVRLKRWARVLLQTKFPRVLRIQ